MKTKVTKVNNDLFKTPPKIPKNAIFYITRKDINKDGVKDYILSVFTKKGKLLFGIKGGDANMYMANNNYIDVNGLTPEQRDLVLKAQIHNVNAQTAKINDETGFKNRFSGAFADSAGGSLPYLLGYGLVKGVSGLFSGD